MSEREEMAENIRRIREAMEEVCAAGERLKAQPSLENLRHYQERVRFLHNTLDTLHHLLTHETSMLGDEINDVLARLLSGHPAPYRPTPRHPGRRVLIVEDEVDTAEMLAEMLSLKGYHVDKVYRAQAALEYLQHTKPDAILLDIMMPTVSGLEVLKYTQSQAHLRDVPVIVLSAKTVSPSEMLKMGAKAFLPKPVTFSELVETLDRLLEPSERA